MNTTFPTGEFWTLDIKDENSDNIDFKARAEKSELQITPVFWVKGNNENMYKKEIKINIADRYIGQDVTGRCLRNKYKIYKVTDYYGLEVFKSEFASCEIQ